MRSLLEGFFLYFTSSFHFFIFYFEFESPRGRGDFLEVTEYAARSDRFGSHQQRDGQEGQGINQVDREHVRGEKREEENDRLLCHGSWEHDRRWRWSTRGDTPKGSMKVRIEGVSWRSVWLWPEQFQFLGAGTRLVWRGSEGPRVNVDWSLSPRIQCLLLLGKSSSSLGLFSSILILCFPSWSSAGKLSWDTLLYRVSCLSVSLQMWLRVGWNTPTDLTRTKYVGTVLSGSYTSGIVGWS